MNILLYTCITLLVAISLILILLVLIQKGRGGGLASAFGGVGGHTAFGSKTGDVLTWATSIVFGVFLILSIITGVVFERVNLASRAGRAATAAQTTGAGGTNESAPIDASEQTPAPAP
ncbi:MAG: preprotein translocase subunit SecG, partial [Anaerolineae bacterium]|nr:preprotein translocase subunit SecG [Phycisphaerae bacterium]